MHAIDNLENKNVEFGSKLNKTIFFSLHENASGNIRQCKKNISIRVSYPSIPLINNQLKQTIKTPGTR